MTDAPTLAVVIPAYNEAARVRSTLATTLTYLAERFPSREVLVIDDGSTDATVQVVETLARDHPELSVLRHARNRGKGAAVRTGVLATSADRVLFMDADHSIPISEVESMMQAMDRGADIVIGSRMLDAGATVRRPMLRDILSRGFRFIVRAVVLEGFRDTQCGFKLFDGSVGRKLFEAVTVEGFAFDVEVLALAVREGYRIDEVQVRWKHSPASTLSPARDSTRMLRDLLRLRLGGLRAHYPHDRPSRR